MNLQKQAEIILQKKLKKAWEYKSKLSRLNRGIGASVRSSSSLNAPWSAEVKLVTASSIQSLNAQFRKKNTPTDVLSFESPAIIRKVSGFIGSIVIATSIAREQAKTQNHSLRDELEVLIVHGILHCLGFDHEKSLVASKKMAQAEQLLLESTSFMKTRRPIRSLKPLKSLILRSRSVKKTG